jgi:hypothetical protein
LICGGDVSEEELGSLETLVLEDEILTSLETCSLEDETLEDDELSLDVI